MLYEVITGDLRLETGVEGTQKILVTANHVDNIFRDALRKLEHLDAEFDVLAQELVLLAGQRPASRGDTRRDSRVADIEHVITSYSIHYTKLYDLFRP